MANIKTARRSGRVFRGGVQRRESLWLFVSGAFATFGAASSGAILGSLNAAALALRPFTVVRTRGYMHIASDQVAAAEQQAINLGYAVVSDQASAIGITAVPTPTTDKGSDLWFVYETLMTSQELNTDLRGIGKEYDSRAMRKVELGQDVLVIAETEVATLTNGVDLRHSARLLIKLH